jgi:hypothetical protein
MSVALSAALSFLAKMLKSPRASRTGSSRVDREDTSSMTGAACPRLKREMTKTERT